MDEDEVCRMDYIGVNAQKTKPTLYRK